MSIRFPNLCVLRSTLLLLSLSITNTVCGETIRQPVDSGLEATAELLEGKIGSKPLLIIHGFLQTWDFFTVRRLAEALNDEGYTVLLPNLTLGINHRRQSLACEAIHTHSMEQDVNEISTWVDWLHQRSGQPVTLIGHSAGSLMLLAYLDGEPTPPVEQTLLVSLVAFAQGPIAKESEADYQRALRQLATDPDAVSSYPLAFCDTYTTTPAHYLSYLNWNGKKTLDSLNKLPLKPTVILGGKDQRLGSDWAPLISEAGAEVIQIEGANHFFNYEYEFSLVDTISELLQHSHNR